MKLVLSAIALSLLLPLTALARTTIPPCKPCGAWQLDVASSQDGQSVLDAAMAKFKPPKMRRMRAMRGDIAAETEAEFANSLIERPGPDFRKHLRDDLLKLVRSPESLQLRQEGEDVVIEAAGGGTRRVTPGEPHARVDELGTAEIVSKWQGASLSITESYMRKTRNREVYTLDAAKGRLLVTRTVQRPGLPDVVVHSTYLMH
jgi:hypothetical protein